MKIVITGLAGFIGYHTAIHFHNNGHEVYGFDNFNTYYDPELKYDRSEDLRINYGILCPNLDLRDNKITEFLSSIRPDLVIHLAASAGVRVSLDQPLEYIDNNITATQKLINSCERAGIENVIYASTSAVMQGCPTPWTEDMMAKNHLSPYGYTKACNEQQFNVSKIKNAVGLRFFTVYGPWGRPDMALFTFTKKMIYNQPITVYNNGDMKRDFTYIDDIVQGIYLVSQNMTERDIYNIGYGKQVDLMDFIHEIESNLGNGKAEYDFQPAHPADAKETWSDTTKLQKLGYKPTTPISVGVKNFVDWYKEYYHETLRNSSTG